LIKGATTPDLNKVSALRDAEALAAGLAGSDSLGKVEAQKIGSDLAKLDADPTLLAALQMRSFVERGLSLVDSAECPLCDHEWPDIDHLKQHLRGKLEKSEEARKLQEELLKNAGAISTKLIAFAGLFGPVMKAAEFLGEKEFQYSIAAWRADLDTFRSSLITVEKIKKHQLRFDSGWLGVPAGFAMGLDGLVEKIKARPDQSSTVDCPNLSDHRAGQASGFEGRTQKQQGGWRGKGCGQSRV
jgi:hypothetical protein